MSRTSTVGGASRHVFLAAAGICAGALSGCFDFGARVPDATDFVDAGVDGGTPDLGDVDGNFDSGPEVDLGVVDDMGPSCVEGMVPPSATGPQIRIVTLNVDSPMLMVSAGDVVTWTNTDADRHQATAGAPGAITPPPRGFDSGVIASGAQWAYRFCTPRTVIWFCGLHAAQMNGYRIVIGG